VVETIQLYKLGWFGGVLILYKLKFVQRILLKAILLEKLILCQYRFQITLHRFKHITSVIIGSESAAYIYYLFCIELVISQAIITTTSHALARYL
jgi:hypothetical protein